MELLQLNKVRSVYSGINGLCCCGCSGIHTRAKAFQKLESERRGYEVKDEECNDRRVALITNKINKMIRTHPEQVQDYRDGDFNKFVSIVVGKRIYVAYTE